MSDVILQRLVAASHGRVPVDVLACPEWGYETVRFAARGSWSVPLQAMVPHEIAADFGCCSACGSPAVEEPLFLSQTVFSAAAAFLLRQAPTTVRPGGVVYECGQCGSADVDFGLHVSRDPISADWIVDAVDEVGHFCLGCGSENCAPAPRPMTSAEHQQARAELRRLAKTHQSRVSDIWRVLTFVSGAHR